MRESLREQIRSALLTSSVASRRVLRNINHDDGNDPSVLILPPASPGSLGDEAVLTSAAAQFRAAGVKRLGIVSYSADDDWRYLGDIHESVVMEDYFSCGSWKDRSQFVRSASRYQQFYVFGTDVMDGFYGEDETLRRLTLAYLAAQSGIPTTLASFSFNECPAASVVDAMRKLPSKVRLCSRDPISRDRLQQHLGRPVELVADVAFLLGDDAGSDLVRSIEDWIYTQRRGDRIIVGVNVNHLLLRQIPNLTPEELVEAHACAIKELFARCDELSFVLIPHDTRGEVNDLSLAQAVVALLPAEIRSRCLAVTAACSPAEIKAACKGLDIALSGKMHLAIACLGQGVPIACIVYQGKFEGLYAHFGLDNMMIEAALAMQPGCLADFFFPLIDRRDEIRNKIQSKLPQILELARANFVPAG
jgi:polysaccharide pyruvyl transferase WcaK-like protein